ncbi:hypothetical protein CMZ84_04365 [Lysobacteraceae bacterium NML93-0399]|nr:hypothetical protein CMZ84_04365 [Xanthomonadaceae bacterium NML93-0399]
MYGRILIAGLLLAAMAGCATVESGRPISEGAIASMVEGQTTEQAARAALGKPQSETTQAGGEKVLVYVHTVGRSNGFTANAQTQTLGLVFDANGVLQRKTVQAIDSRSR